MFFAHSILPSSGISFPVIIFINVDFPSPLAPTSPICSPFNNLNDTSSNIALSPKPCVRCSTFNKLIYNLHSFYVILILPKTSKSSFSAYTDEKGASVLNYNLINRVSGTFCNIPLMNPLTPLSSLTGYHPSGTPVGYC